MNAFAKRAVAAACLWAGAVCAQEEDLSSLYDVSTTGTPRVKAGEKGKLVLAIQPKGGAHISDEAPLKVELASTRLKLDKQKLSRPDAAPGPTPRFEVAFTGEAAGKGSVDAKVTFFLCTEKICSKQQKSVSLPVDVL